MARPAKKQQPQKFEEPDEAEGWEDAVVDADDKEGQNLRLRDWRDVERFRELKDLRRLVDDDYGLEEIFHIPVKPRTDLGIPAPHTPPGKPAKGAPGKIAPPVKGAPPPKGAPPAKPASSGAKARSEGNAPAVKGVPPKAPLKAVPAKAAAPVKHAKPAAKPAAKAHKHVKAKAKRK